MGAGNPLDLQVLNALIGDDVEFQKNILRAFCTSANTYCDELDLAYSRRSCEEVAAIAHKLKSSAQTVGAGVLGQLCEQLEAAGRHGSWNIIETCYPQVRPELKAISAFVERYIA